MNGWDFFLKKGFCHLSDFYQSLIEFEGSGGERCTVAQLSNRTKPGGQNILAMSMSGKHCNYREKHSTNLACFI